MPQRRTRPQPKRKPPAPKPKAKLTARAIVELMQSMPQAAAAWLIGRSARTFRDLQPPPPRNDDGSYDAQAIVEWARGSGEADPLLSGGESPSLERYRTAKANLAELEVEERRGRLVDVEQVAEFWEIEVATPIRRAIETLQAQHGPAAAELIAAAVRKADAAIDARRPAKEITDEDGDAV